MTWQIKDYQVDTYIADLGICEAVVYPDISYNYNWHGTVRRPDGTLCFDVRSEDKQDCMEQIEQKLCDRLAPFWDMLEGRWPAS